MSLNVTWCFVRGGRLISLQAGVKGPWGLGPKYKPMTAGSAALLLNTTCRRGIAANSRDVSVSLSAW